MPIRAFASAAMTCSRPEIAAAILRLAERRGPDASFCPSEVARLLADDWRPLMEPVRAVASELAAGGQILATQKGAKVNAARARGPIRLRLAGGGR